MQPLTTVQPFTPTPVPIYRDEPIHPARVLTARLEQWCATDPVVAEAVSALNAARGTPLTVALVQTPVGSAYRRESNTIVLSPRYAARGLASIADKLVLYRLATGLLHLEVDVYDAVALQAFNTRQERLWRLANPPQDPAPGEVYRFYHGTNRSNFYGGATSIAVAGLCSEMAGGDLGCKRWEKQLRRREPKDQGWHTVTLDYDVALSYARQHTEWAMGMKEKGDPERDVTDYGGLVLSFDVPRASVDGNDHWRLDNSGDRNNYQTMDAIPAGRIRVVEELAVPGPLRKVVPPPTSAQTLGLTADVPQRPGGGRRVYPKTDT